MDKSTQRSGQLGFTLIELMIVVVVVAILAAIAFPAYGRYTERARRTAGQNLLLGVAAAQERFFTTNNRYTFNAADLRVATTSENGNYTLAIAAGPTGDTQSFTLTAAPAGAQVSDGCGSLTYNSLGVRGSTGTTTNGSCWSN